MNTLCYPPKTSVKICYEQLSGVRGTLGNKCGAEFPKPESPHGPSGDSGMKATDSEAHMKELGNGDLEFTLLINSISEKPMHLTKCSLDCHPNHQYRVATGLKRPLSYGGTPPETAFETYSYGPAEFLGLGNP